ncbi:sensor domain-containing diguanylate cyclase [Cohnella luojiensis]|uniref:GGDEF domain-containing protein n=1 Tax=Cohnella luojiensis TaxID=652876 RepID=A0A4Y8M571_9BACL|nr:GGDEF domain-containing protein [Cohnella luojiensis]TFE30790.1 GGDEF domain-containing protein [Cohnella luojiensis]
MYLITLTPNNLGLLFSSAMAVVIVSLMLFMSYRLYGRNRKRAYRSLITSLAFILIHHMLQLMISLELTPPSPALVFIGKLLQVYAFIVINFAVFELYHRRRPRTRLWFFGLLVTGLLIAMGDILPGVSANDRDWLSRMQTTPALDTFLLLLGPLFVLMFAPHIGQPRKYMTSLTIAFTMQLAVMSGTYWAPGIQIFKTIAGLLPVFYYILLFALLFERVVEILQSVYRSSITDGLTNLYNRRYFMGRLEQALQAGRPVGVIFCDIDNFKKLNDTHGHHKADGVLKQVSALLMEETEGAGLAGRYGGEELVAFVIGTPIATLQAAESIRSRTEKETIVTISVGFSIAAEGDTAESLMKQADQAMYHSKTSGKNRVTDYATIKAADAPEAVKQRRGS